MSPLPHRGHGTPRAICTVVLLACLAFPSTVLAASTGTSKLRGVLRDADGKPVGGATVVLTLMESAETRLTGSTDSGGKYQIEAMPYGHYQVVFDVGGKSYASNRIVTVPPRRKLQADFSVGPCLPQDEGLGLKAGAAIPGVGTPLAGVARLEEKTGPSGLAWFTTGKGVAVLVASGAAVVAGLIALSSGDNTRYSTSPQR